MRAGAHALVKLSILSTAKGTARGTSRVPPIVNADRLLVNLFGKYSDPIRLHSGSHCPAQRCRKCAGKHRRTSMASARRPIVRYATPKFRCPLKKSAYAPVCSAVESSERRQKLRIRTRSILDSKSIHLDRLAPFAGCLQSLSNRRGVLEAPVKQVRRRALRMFPSLK